MNFNTFMATIVLGLLGALFFAWLMGFPDGGAIVAIAFVGGRIVGTLEENNSKEKNNSKEEKNSIEERNNK